MGTFCILISAISWEIIKKSLASSEKQHHSYSQHNMRMYSSIRNAIYSTNLRRHVVKRIIFFVCIRTCLSIYFSWCCVREFPNYAVQMMCSICVRRSLSVRTTRRQQGFSKRKYKRVWKQRGQCGTTLFTCLFITNERFGIIRHILSYIITKTLILTFCLRFVLHFTATQQRNVNKLDKNYRAIQRLIFFYLQKNVKLSDCIIINQINNYEICIYRFIYLLLILISLYDRQVISFFIRMYKNIRIQLFFARSLFVFIDH